MIAEALRYADDPNAPRVEGCAAAAPAPVVDHRRRGTSRGARRTRRVLMTGVSYMIPFVAAGGLLIALSFLLGGYEIVGPGNDIATSNSLFNLPDVDALGLDHALFGSGLFAYLGARALHPSAGRPSASWSRRWPATSPTPSPTVPASPPASSWVPIAVTLQSGFLGGIVGGVLAGVSRTGSPPGRCRPGPAA